MNGMMLLWGLNQQRQASAAQADAARATSRAATADRNVESLIDRLDKLTLVNMAVWSLVSEQLELTEEQLVERVREIDLADGVEDGKVTAQVAKCPKCGRVMSPRHKKCLYCGAAKLNITAFDKTM